MGKWQLIVAVGRLRIVDCGLKTESSRQSGKSAIGKGLLAYEKFNNTNTGGCAKQF